MVSTSFINRFTPEIMKSASQPAELFCIRLDDCALEMKLQKTMKITMTETTYDNIILQNRRCISILLFRMLHEGHVTGSL